MAIDQALPFLEQEIPLHLAKAFFADWHKLAVPADATPPIDCGAFDNFAQDFAKHYPTYCQSGLLTNVWQLARVGRDELRNSQILAWILDKHGDHGYQSSVLEMLIEYAAAIVASPEQRINVVDVALGDYVTRTESAYYYPGETDSRVDIEIEGASFFLVIEVKVDAGETNDQLRRYIEIAERKRAFGRKTLVVFLTPSGRAPADVSLKNEIVPIAWRQLADILKSACASMPETFSLRLFDQFADHICTF